MSLPDSPDLSLRRHRVTVEGRSDRFQTLPYLASSFVQSKLIESAEREMWREGVSDAQMPRPAVADFEQVTPSQMLDRLSTATGAARELSRRVSWRALSYLGVAAPKVIGVRGDAATQ